MIFDQKLSKLVEQGDGRYLLVNVIRRRARDLYSGAKPLVRVAEDGDAGKLAFKEILHDRLRVTRRKTPPKFVDLAKQEI